MKKGLIFLSVILFIMFLIGCSNNNAQNNNEQNNEQINNNENNNDSNESNENTDMNEGNEEDEAVDGDINEDNGKEEDEDEVVEVQDPLYELTEVWTVRPIEPETTNSNVVLLTIDDSFDTSSKKQYYALEMAEILQNLDASAIFFVNGAGLQGSESHIEENREMLRKLYEMGFEIGNHTMTHPNLREISEEEQRQQIVELNDLIEEIIGERPRFFRAPFGANTDYSRQVVEEEGMQWMNWSYGFDYFPQYVGDAEALTEIMLDPTSEGVSLTNGANLLMHDRDFTTEALHDIVVGLQEKGFEIVNPSLIK
ncbi:polysaccharide deacetylase family protein [Evansella sp. AB-P1]|uniref:polysaccharide deacetylase family protein n=1 Tax=Evansella sp. AB-P1 TaxID=3037653 RepID=UPI00241EF826|nr:polysaccharide deacetylase family protein [Evansella sp. AB-P1]MDG5789481.1 polysaccharide deacetylase family protein [Evansella sp. AB-P1]